jgi:hypothetical protein
MKHFKFLIINIIAFSLLFFFFSLLFPGQVVTSNTISINAPKGKVKEKILATENWKDWTQFIKANDVERQNWNYMDTMIFSVENNHHTDLNTQFVFYTEQNNSTLLNWAIIEKLPWYKPWKKFSAMVLDKQVAAVMDTSLVKFKAQIETGK